MRLITKEKTRKYKKAEKVLLSIVICLFLSLFSTYTPCFSLELLTTWDDNNNQAGIFFDVVAKKKIKITKFYSSYNGAGDVTIWHRTGSGYDKKGANTDWTEEGPAAIAGAGDDLDINIDLAITINKDATHGFFIRNDTSATLYTNGTGVGNVAAENDDLQILEGHGATDFGGTFYQPRLPNVRIEYELVADPIETPIITDPLGLIYTNDSSPKITGTVDKDNAKTVKVYVNGVEHSSVDISSDDWSLDLSPALADGGPYVITAKAFSDDSESAFSTQIVSIIVDTIAPVKPIITATEPDKVTIITTNTTPSITGLTEANSTVTLLIDAVLHGTTPLISSNSDRESNSKRLSYSATSAWSYDISPALSADTYILTAKATDRATNESSLSDEITLIIVNSASSTDETLSLESFAAGPNPIDFSTQANFLVQVKPNIASNYLFQVYDLSRTLVYSDSGTLGVGTTPIEWNGQNKNGHMVANGPYIGYFVVSDGSTSIRKKVKIGVLK